MDYTSKIVDKPWGYEYLIYQNQHVGLWYLNIEPGQSTSMHCHPNKNTGLILLDGDLEVSFLNDSVRLNYPDKLMIRRGLFHSSRATGETASVVLEIETPRDKHDLVRLEDKYGREQEAYEGKNFERPKTEDCLWLEEPTDDVPLPYNFGRCRLTMERVRGKDELLEGRHDDDILIFLRGGIFKEDEKRLYVAQPGDVVVGKTLEKIATTFDLDDEIFLLSIRKKEDEHGNL